MGMGDVHCVRAHVMGCLGSRPQGMHGHARSVPMRHPLTVLLSSPLPVHQGAGIAPVAGVCLQQLTALLLAVCKNPTQPGFNHYLFESVAALIK